jgi:hypothetical protein
MAVFSFITAQPAKSRKPHDALEGEGAPHPSMIPKELTPRKGWDPFPTKVAPIFGPRYVAKLVRSTAALWGDGDPTPIKPALGSCDLPKIDSNVA